MSITNSNGHGVTNMAGKPHREVHPANITFNAPMGKSAPKVKPAFKGESAKADAFPSANTKKYVKSLIGIPDIGMTGPKAQAGQAKISSKAKPKPFNLKFNPDRGGGVVRYDKRNRP